MRFNVQFSVITIVFFAALIFTSFNFFDVSAQIDKEISPADIENSYRANNIGVARLEQFDYAEAVKSFREVGSITLNSVTIIAFPILIACWESNNSNALMKFYLKEKPLRENITNA
jgi:hypothetical protein